jgi:hypothetical protein
MTQKIDIMIMIIVFQPRNSEQIASEALILVIAKSTSSGGAH